MSKTQNLIHEQPLGRPAWMLGVERFGWQLRAQGICAAKTPAAAKQ